MLHGLDYSSNARDQEDSFYSDPSPAYTIQYPANSSSLSPTQEEIFLQYYEFYFAPTLKTFVESAPKSPNLQPTRQFIILQAVKLDCEIFLQFLNVFYPALTEHHPNFAQNTQCREFMLAFNALCKGQTDINHILFTHIFDTRISPNKTNSPTKRNLLVGSLKKKIYEEFVEHDIMQDRYVQTMNLWLKDMPPMTSAPTARKQLFL